MKPHVDNKLQRQFMKTLSFTKNTTQETSPSTKINKRIPHMREYDIK